MTQTARAVTNAQGRVVGEFDYTNLKAELLGTAAKEIFRAKKKESKKARLGDLFSDKIFNLVAKHVESEGVNHATQIEYGRTENKTIKFIETPSGMQFREQAGRIFGKRSLEAA